MKAGNKRFLRRRRTQPEPPEPRTARVPKVRLAILVARAYRQMDFSKLKSRKLWATVIGGVIVTVGSAVGVSENVLHGLVAVVSAYVIGQGIADHGAKGRSQCHGGQCDIDG